MSEYRQQQCQRLLEALERESILGLTRRQLADVLGIKKSQYLYGLIDELLSRNLAIGKYLYDTHNRKVFIYFPNDLPGETKAT